MIARFISIFLVVTAFFGNVWFGYETPVSVKPPEPDEIYPANPTYDGYEFTILTQYNDKGDNYFDNLIVCEEESGDFLSEAVWRRNSMISEKYDVNFEHIQVRDLLTTVRTQVMGGVTEFDVILGRADKLAVLAREGMLYDLNTVEGFDMSENYWDSNAAEQLKIGDKLYFTNCDMNVQELGYVVYFNKQLIKDLDLTSPYEYMKKNEWTIDNWAGLVKSVSKDMNGDGSLTEIDMYGTLYEHHNARMFLYGAGVRATTNNSDGVPEITLFDNSKTVTVYEKCKDVFSSPSSWCIDDMSNSDTHGYSDKWEYARSLFCQDLYLFHYAETNIIRQFADMESEFGIVPFPKYDQTQKDYQTLYPDTCNLVAIPAVQGDIERTANIVEDLNYYSSVIIKPVWYDTLLCRRYTRDDESTESLAIIFAGRVYDVGMYYDFGGICHEILDQDVRRSNINTLFARRQKAIQADINATYRDFGLVD